MKIRKIGTDDIRKKRNDGKPEEETYKVRVAVTLAHYVLVTAKDHDDAEKKVEDYVHELGSDLDRWMEEASHINTSFEVEEADDVGGSEFRDIEDHEEDNEEVQTLNACPKCGSDSVRFIHPAFDGGSYVRCCSCSYSPQKETWAPTDAEASKKWNGLERKQ